MTCLIIKGVCIQCSSPAPVFEVCEYISDWQSCHLSVIRPCRVVVIRSGERSSIHARLCIPVISRGKRVACECNKPRFSWIQSTDETVRHKCLFVHAVQSRWSFSFITSEKQSGSMKDRRHVHLDRTNGSHSCECNTCLVFFSSSFLLMLENKASFQHRLQAIKD